MSDWFLPRHERPWTEGNRVVPHVHGAAYFARLLHVVRRAGPGDRIFFTDWRGDADERLTDDGPTIGELLCEAAARGVEVRGLLWRSHSDRTRFNAQENRHLGTMINEAGGEALFDERVRRGGSHHQKLVVIRYRDRPADDVAFVGGIDLCHGRRDDAVHGGDRQPAPLDPKYGPHPPWHDAMLEIHGPAVDDVLGVFCERWDDPTPLDHRNPYRAFVRWRAHVPRHPQPLPEHWDAPPVAGPHQVQILRTYPSKQPAYPFARGGERSIARAYGHAFARSRRLVYLEDQYLWSPHVVATLADALRREPALHVVAVVPRYPEDDSTLNGTAERLGRQRAVDALRRAGGERFALYDVHNPEGTPVYVHAKVCVVDDTWMTCGSDNLNLRSWTHDSEITCAVVDPEGHLAEDLRVALWAEHLGLPPDDERLRDLDRAGGLWAERAGRPDSRVRRHDPPRVSRSAALWAGPLYRTVFDPDGRPRRLRGTDRF